MIWLGAGVSALALVLCAAATFGRANPKTLAGVAKWIGIAAMGLAGLFLVTRDAFIPAFVIFGTAATWAGWGGQGFPGFGGGRPSPGGHSTVETPWLRMVLDHDSGDTDGEILKGDYAGRRLTDLSLAELRTLLRAARRDDPDTERLLEAYIVRRFPDADLAEEPPVRRPVMDRDEALAVLGLGATATPDEIRAAHKALMVKLHPDRGGSDYLAAKINAARDYLLAERQAT